METARYGPQKKSISAPYYRESKHGELMCRYCEGRMTIVRSPNRAPHFRVIDRSTHTCKYFSNEIEKIVEICATTVKMDRKNNESPIFHLDFEAEMNNSGIKRNETESIEESEYVPYISTQSIRIMEGRPKLKTRFKFVSDMHALIFKNPKEQVLNCRFTIKENGVIKKVKASELIPNYQTLMKLHEKNKLNERKRFILGTILSAKETSNGNVEVTLYGEKIEGNYYNHKIFFMKKVIIGEGLHISDFFRDRTLVCYVKPMVGSSKREFISFIHKSEEFDFGKLTSKDGDWVNSKEEREIDNFLYYQNIAHDVPDINLGKEIFSIPNDKDKFYVPDWILYIDSQKVIVEYFGFYTDEYKEKMTRKIEYFSHLEDYLFINLYKSDLKDEFMGIKQKLCSLFPNMHFTRGSRY